MKISKLEFSSNKIIEKEVNNLIAERLIKNMNLTTDNKSINNTNNKDKNQISINNLSGIINTADSMFNFLTLNKCKSIVKSNNTKNNTKDKLKCFKNRSNTSNKIANDVISLKNSFSSYDSLINNSINFGLQASKLGQSLLEVSLNKSRIRKVNSIDKNQNTSLKYQDYIQNRPSSDLRPTSVIKISYDAMQPNILESSNIHKPKDVKTKKLNTKLLNKSSIANNKQKEISTVKLDNIDKETSINNKSKKEIHKLKIYEFSEKNKNKIEQKFLLKVDEKDELKNNIKMGSDVEKLKKKPIVSKLDKLRSDRISVNKQKIQSNSKNINIFNINIDQINYGTNPSKSSRGEKKDIFTDYLPEVNRKSMVSTKKSELKKDDEKNFEKELERNTPITLIENPKINIRKLDLATESKSLKKELNNLSDINIIPDHFINEDTDYAEVDEFDVKEHDKKEGKVNKIYKSYSKAKILDLNENSNSINFEYEKYSPMNKYDELLNKLLFNGNDTNINETINSIDSKISNKSKAKILEEDLENILKSKNNLKKIKHYYEKEIKKTEKELTNLEICRITENEKIREKKEKEIQNLKLKILKEEDNLFMDIEKNMTSNDTDMMKVELEALKANLILKENNYKKIIKNLLNELKNYSTDSNINEDISNSGIILNDPILKEVNEVIENSVVDEKYLNYKILSSTENNITCISTNNIKDNVNNKNNSIICTTVKLNNLDDDSMIAELDEFKQDDMSNYKFEIPLKYQISKNCKVQSEDFTKDGKLVKYYENSVVEIVNKNKNVSRLFPDGYSITFYNNKDIKQNFPTGKCIFYYSKNKSLQFNIPNEGFIAYKFRNKQFEKHYFDGRKYIKFSDGSIKIIRPNGEELNEFVDKSLQRKNKSGNITNIK